VEKMLSILKYFYENADVLKKIENAELRDVISMTMLIMNENKDFEKKKQAFIVSGKVAQCGKLPIQERWAVYWSMVYRAFVDNDYVEVKDMLDEVYLSIYNTVASFMPEQLKKDDMIKEKNGIVVIVTSQFLSEGHAPTRRILDYSYTMQKKLGKKIIIINDCGMRYQHYEYMQENVSFNCIDELSEKDIIHYKDTEFKFYQTKSVMPDLQEIGNIVWNIKKLSPELVLCVGASCLTADLCNYFVKTAVITCSTEIPTSAADNLIVCRSLREDDEQKINNLLSGQKLIESIFNYQMPADELMRHYRREEFQLSEGDWVIAVAGNRLNAELTSEFLKCIDEVLSSIQQAHFFIVGDVDQRRIEKCFKNKDKVHFGGTVQDGSQAIRLSDVYVQPRRRGGGRAAFEALYYGIPAIIPDFGDAWDVCGNAFEVHSYDEMREKLVNYYENKNLYDQVSKVASEHARKLENMQETFRELFQKLGVAYEEDIYVETSKFKPIFKTCSEKKQEMIEEKIDNITKISYIAERRLRDNEWAVVYNSTVNGSTWMKNVSLSPGRCAIAWPGLYALYRSLDEFQPKSILEMGLGQSTRVISNYVAYYDATHYIVEHDKEWIDFFLDKHGVSKNTEIINLERVEGEYSGRYIHTETPIMYYNKFKETFEGKKFDFVFIDGPQGSNGISRVDFTEILPEALMESFVIMIDDSERQGESRTIDCICNILNKNNIPFYVVAYDGMKNTSLIVSQDLLFLCSL